LDYSDASQNEDEYDDCRWDVYIVRPGGVVGLSFHFCLDIWWGLVGSDPDHWNALLSVIEDDILAGEL
jgi:hypothetical protein